MSDPVLPPLGWLRVFEAAARTESFARAAEELHLSAPAVSQQVKALETRLGTPLFLRGPQRVTLTEAGQAYLPPVQQALQMLGSATEGLFGARREDRLFVQAILLFAHGILAPRMAAFSRAHPEIALSLTTANAPVEFQAGFHDLRIMFGGPQGFGRTHDVLLGERLYPVATPEVASAIATPVDLLAHPLIEVATHRAGWPWLFDAAGLPAGRARLVFADSTVMAAALASEGLGIALARAPASDKAVAEAGLVPCLPGWEVTGQQHYHLVYEDRSSLRRPARVFRDWLIAECEAL